MASPVPLHGVYKALLNGVHERGEGGFLYVKGGECAYLKPHELVGQPQVSEALAQMLADEKAAAAFYVAEERDGQLHLLAYPKETVYRAVAEAARVAPPKGADAEPRVQEL